MWQYSFWQYQQTFTLVQQIPLNPSHQCFNYNNEGKLEFPTLHFHFDFRISCSWKTRLKQKHKTHEMNSDPFLTLLNFGGECAFRTTRSVACAIISSAAHCTQTLLLTCWQIAGNIDAGSSKKGGHILLLWHSVKEKPPCQTVTPFVSSLMTDGDAVK